MNEDIIDRLTTGPGTEEYQAVTGHASAFP